MAQVKKSIIIIDSDMNLIEDLQRRFMLEPDFEIINTASMGMDGFGKVQIQQPNFIVLSSTLPDMDAIQLLNNISMVAPQSKKIIALDVENPIMSTQFMQAGANYTITKPYSADKLIDVLKTVSSRSANSAQYGGGINNGYNPNPRTMGGAPIINQGTPTGAGSPSIDQLRNAMNQFSQECDKRDVNPNQSNPQGAMGGSMGTGSYPPYNPMGENVNREQPNYGGNFQQPNNMGMNPGMGMGMNPGIGMGGMPQYGNLSQGQSNMGMGSNVQRGEGFRTLKQTTIAVNCPKGGVGKTTLSKELALAYSTVKVNGQPLKVCLVDCDLDFGDVTSMLKLNPYPNITHWTSDISQRLRENPSAELKYTQQQIETKYLITHPTGLKILPAPSNHTDALDITGKEMEIILDNLKNCNFDVIILDTGNNTKDYTLISLDKASVILMVTTLDVTTINDTNLLLNTLRSIQFPTSKIQLIVNRMPKTDKDIDTSEISQVLRSNIMGVIPEYPKIRQLNNSGTPAMLGKECEFTAAVRKIANIIVPVFNRPVSSSSQGRSNRQNQMPNGNKGGFFSRLFGMR